MPLHAIRRRLRFQLRDASFGAGGLFRNRARRRGIQVGTIDAVLAQLCIRYELRLLTTDADFARIAEHEPL